MKSRGKRVIQEVDYGIYVWEMPDGRWVADDEGHFATSTMCTEGSGPAQKALGDLVRAHSREAYELGKPKFLPGRRPISDEEYEEQQARLDAGLVPDKYDLPAQMEELRRGNR